MSTAPAAAPNPAATTGPQFPFMNAADLIAGSDICVQCGVCLSVCPTYAMTGEEIQSPRGRVMLYRAAAEGLTDQYPVVLQAAYDCLDCRACQTVCPSNVKPGEMAVETRVALQGGKPHGAVVKAMLWAFKHPGVVDAGNLGVRVYQRTGIQKFVRRTRVLHRLGKLGKALANAEELVPDRPVAPSLRTRVRELSPAEGERRGKVAFFLGCVMNALLSDASAATVRVLNRNGFDVLTPRATTCCGAPHIEEGDLVGFKEVARRNLDLYAWLDVDAVITDCAACGAELKKYARYFADDPAYAAKAQLMSSRSYGLSEFLRRNGLPELPAAEGGERTPVTYQDACHLCHGQGVCDQPREVLKANPTVEYRELQNASDCCGSAGVYNVTHPGESARILERKMERVRLTGAKVLAAENPGCLLQLDAGARRYGVPVKVMHTALILEDAYRRAEKRG